MAKRQSTSEQFSINFLLLALVAFGTFAAGYTKSGLDGGVVAFFAAWFASFGLFSTFASFSESTAEKIALVTVGVPIFLCSTGILIYTLYY